MYTFVCILRKRRASNRDWKAKKLSMQEINVTDGKQHQYYNHIHVFTPVDTYFTVFQWSIVHGMNNRVIVTCNHNHIHSDAHVTPTWD